jgi:hypothetical protein
MSPSSLFHTVSNVLHWLLARPVVVQVVGGSLTAYFLTERWQRRRQRREFQQRALTKLSEIAGDFHFRVTELIEDVDTKRPNGASKDSSRELLRGEDALSTLETELISAFRRQDVRKAYADLSVTASFICEMSRPNRPLDMSLAARVQRRFLAQMRVIQSRMLREMRVASRRQLQRQERKFRQYIQPTDSCVQEWKTERTRKLGL